MEYIKKEDAVKAMYKAQKDKTWSMDSSDVMEQMIDYVEKLPAAAVTEIKYGQWVWDDNAIDWGIGGWVCDQCHATNENIHAQHNNSHYSPFDDPYCWTGSKYCPNCGVKMKGDK